MRGALLLLGALAALTVTACGDAGTRTITKTVQAGATTPTTDTAAIDEAEATDGAESDDCDVLGVNPDVGNEGRCVSDGQRYAVVNRSSELKLRTLAARVLDISTTKTVSGGYESDTADNVFVVIRMTVRNRSNQPQTFDSGGSATAQVSMLIDEKTYTPDFDVQNGPQEDSFVWQGKEIQPGASQTGTAVFDIPAPAVRKIDSDGQLNVLDFGNAFSNLSAESNPELGVIRLWQ